MKLTIADVPKYKSIKVFLDEEEMKHVFEADDIEDYVWHYPVGDDGNPQWDEHANDVVKEQSFGKVRFELEEN